MAADTSPGAVAARLRGILGGADRGMIEATARRLQVSEVALRISIDEIEPHPALEVLIAVVRHHGVDPTWLVTGQYDATTHRAAINDEAALSNESVGELLVKRMLGTPDGKAPKDRSNLRLEA